MLARKYLQGDIVEHSLSETRYKILLIHAESDEATIIPEDEICWGNENAQKVPLAELNLVKPSIHTSRPFKPVREMSEHEMREHIRLLREGRFESIGYKKKKKRKTKTRTKETEFDKLRAKYPDYPDLAISMMVKHGEETALAMLGKGGE